MPSKGSNSISKVYLIVIVTLFLIQVLPFEDSVMQNARGASIWFQTTQGDFQAGNGENITITPEGNVTLDLQTNYVEDDFFDVSKIDYARNVIVDTDAGEVRLNKINKTFGGATEDQFYSIKETSDGGFVMTGHTYSFDVGNGDVWLVKTDFLGNGQWYRTFGAVNIDRAYSVQQTTDGGYIITGYTQSFGPGGYNLWLIKTNETGDELWNKVFGGDGHDYGQGVQQTTDGGYIITGRTASFGGSDLDVWLIKTNSSGNEQWNQTFGGTSSDYGYSVQQTSDLGYIIAGHTYSYDMGGGDAWLIKTDSSGNMQWNSTFGLSPIDRANSVQQTTDSGYIIAGYTASYDVGGGYDVWLIKTDSSGNELWNNSFGGSENDYGQEVQQTEDSGYIISGSTYSYGVNTPSQRNSWLIKTDFRGMEQWNKIFGGSSIEYGYSVQQTSDGGYVLAGTTWSYGPGGADGWLIKTDSSDVESWERTWGGTSNDMCRETQETSDGGYILAGYSRSFGNPNYDAWLIKTDPSGIEQWNKTYGGSGHDYAYSVQQTSDGGYIIAGYTPSFGPALANGWLIKTDSSGNEQWNKTFGGDDDDYCRAVIETSDGDFVIAGYTQSFGIWNNNDGWLIKTNETGDEQWNYTFDGSGSDYCYTVQETFDNGYILAGYTNSFGPNTPNFWLIKTDSAGAEQWNNTFDGGSSDYGNSAKQTSDGGYIITGYSSIPSFGYDVWLIKTDSSGNELWNNTFGGTSSDYGNSVLQTANDGFIIIGRTYSFDVGGGDAWLIRTDSTGTMLWGKTFGGTGTDYSYSVLQTPDGGYVMGGYSNSFGPVGYQAWLIKTDSADVESWSRPYGGFDDDYGYAVQQTADNGYITAGTTYSFDVGGGDAWLIKTESSGNHQWDSTFGGSSPEECYSVQQTSDGGYIICGQTTIGFTPYAYLLKTDSSGNEEWDKTFGGGSGDYGYFAQQTSDGGYIITGYTYSWGPGGADTWLIKTNETGVEQWNKTFGGSGGNDAGWSVQQTSPDGGYIIVGVTGSYGPPGSGYNFWLIKTDSSGNEEWNNTFGGDDTDYGWSGQQTSDGGYIITGYIGSGVGNSDDVFLIKTNETGAEQWNKTFGGYDDEIGYSVQQTLDGGYIVGGYTNSYGINNKSGYYNFWLIKTDYAGNERWFKIFGGNRSDRGRAVQQTSDSGYIFAGYTASYGIDVPNDYNVWLVKDDSNWGEIRSNNLLMGDQAYSFNDFTCVVVKPLGTGIKVQFSKDYFNWYNSTGSLNEWDTLSHGTNFINLTSLGWNGSEFYYRFNFYSDGLNSPILKNINLTYQRYFPSGWLESVSYDAGGDVTWRKLFWNATTPADTEIIFQLRTATTEAGLSAQNFVGPGGDTDTFYTVSNSNIWAGHNGEQWIQYKAYFDTANGMVTATMENVTILYNLVPGPPTLISPTDGLATNVNTPLFEWNFMDSDGSPGGFQVLIDNDINFLSVDYDSGQQGSSGESWQFPDGTGYTVIADGVWYWKVRTQDNDGDWGPYSDPWGLIIDTVPPNVDAGTDATVNAIYLQDATVSDPAPSSGIDTYLWTQESGPGTVTFGTADAEDTTVSANTDGTYVCRLTVTDNAGNIAFDEFTLIWDTVLPSVDAGTDATVNALYLQDATVSDPAPSSGIATYLWTQESGPGTVTFGTPGAEDTNVGADTDGTYVCRLTVTDNAGNYAFDEFTLIWDTVSPTVDAGTDATVNALYSQDATAIDPVPASGIATYLWTQESGPGTVTFGTADMEDTTVSADADGTYVCRLNVTDNAGNYAYDEFTLIWDTVSPSVDAGTDATVNALYTQDATVSDPAPASGIATYLWTQESGPGTVTFGTPGAVDTTVSADTDGTYECRLTVTDNAGNSAIDDFTLIWDTVSPTVDAGTDATVNALYSQDATVSDSAPSSGIATYLWTQESGPGTVTFGTPDAVDTTVSADTDGTYVCRLNVTDNAGNYAFDEFTLIWDTVSPTVDAGTDATENAQYLQGATATDPAPASGITTYLWTQESGPGTVTFGTPDAEDTTVSADTDGTYVCRLNVTDNAGNYAYDEFTLVWDATPPTVNAGTDATVNASYLQDATVSDPAPSSGIATYLWTRESGPGTVTFGTPDAVDTTVSADTDGTYVCRLNVTDNAGNYAFDEFTLIWDTVSPTVDAGTDATENAQYLQGATATDPAPASGITTYLWTQESGPGTVTFGTPDAEDTTVSADTDGTYVCRLNVTDNAGNYAYDEFTLVWDTVSPSVDAGTDATVNVPYTQDATVNDPAPSSGIASYLWTQESGPGTVTFGTPDAEDTTVSADTDGIYVCRLTVTDNAGNVAFDEFLLIWSTGLPLVYAGPDATVNASYLQNATVNDPVAGIATYNWTQESGPGIVTFGTPDAEDTTVSADTDGTYVCRLNVTDNAGNYAYDEFTLVWDTVSPTVDAGTDSTVNATYLQDATATDPAPASGIAIYNWTQESGPGTVTFGTPDTEDTTVSADTDGTYVCRLNVTDNAGNYAFDEFTLIWDATPPSVDAGTDATVNASYLQDATLSDPAPSSGIASILWTQESGPGTVTFGTPDAEDTTVSADTDGTYVCRLNVTDNAGNYAFDEFTLIWDTTPPNVDAGPDTAANALYLQDATVTDPAPASGIATYLWTQESGPGTVTFGTPDAEDTTVSADTDGTYVCRLNVTDNAGNYAFDEFTLVWDTVLPTVDAGTDATVNALYSQDATVSDSAPSSGIASILWTQESGPGTVTFGTPDAEDTTVSADTDGTYVCRLNVTDNAGNFAFDEFTLVWDATPPTVDAGIDAAAIALYLQDATVSDPAPGSGIALYNWTQESGPGTVTFGTPDAVDTTVSADTDGTYVCRLNVTDIAGNYAFDEFTLIWDTVSPTVDAGTDATVNALYSQDATASDPAPSSGITYIWTQESGPGTVTFGTPDTEDTTVSADADGTYVCRLNVTDNAGNYVFDEFTLIWDATPPSVDAGTDATVNALYLQDATVSDPAPNSGIATNLWTQESGPGTVTFGTPGAVDTTVSADTDGTYVCRLNVTDIAGNYAFDEFTLIWDTVLPTVDAGTDATENALYSQDATVSDPAPSSGIASYLWTQESGPGTVTFGTPGAEDTTVNADTDGTYVCRLNVTDNAGNYAFDEFTLVWDATSPTVDAGTDATENALYSQDATVSDPAPSSGIASYLWTQESGPGTVTFGTPDAVDTTVSADTDGTYVCRLNVTDTAGNYAFDEFTLIWDTVLPTVNAGTDATVNALYTQDATVIDPVPASGIATYLWTAESGPGIVNFGTPGAEDTTVTANTDGIYVCRLNVTDNAGNYAFDEFTLIWDTVLPTVNAGTDATVNALYLQDATASDPIPSSGIASYFWTPESGPGIVTFGTPGAEDTTVSANTDGIYVCRLTVTDNASNSAFDEFTLVWDATPPTVDAGTDAAANTIYMQDATVSDPAPSSGIATYLWTQESGPGTVTFGTSNAVDTTVSADTDGTYVCRLTVTDNTGNSAFDEFTLLWDTTPPNVDAGADAVANVIYLQDATVSDPAPSSGIDLSWTQESGLGIVMFGSPNAEDTIVGVDTDGTYVCRLTVTDNAGNSAFDEFTLIWDTVSPSVDAGTDATVNVIYFQDASVSDPAPSSGIATYNWTQESGPGTVIFGSPNLEDTAVGADADGTYICRLTVTDNAGNSAFDEFTLVWDTVSPSVDAGTDATVNVIYFQDASVSDPAPSSGIATYNWTQESGPGTVIFGSPNLEDTAVGADADGTYICRLTVTDNAGNSAFDEFTLIWDTVQPTVDAGSDATVNTLYSQDATVSDPAPSSGIASYLWTQESGPGTVTFGTPDAEDTTVSADTDGTYVCRLTVIDNTGNSAFDEFTLVWDTVQPTVDAGTDATVNALYLQDASVSDPAPSSGIASYLWTQESGPGTVTFGSPDAVDTTVSANTDGTYVCRLTVTDNAGNIAFDEFTLVWDTIPPNVNAGSDATINLTYLQDATVSDPAPSSGIATYLWTQESGPGTVTFGTPDAEDTTVSANTDGTYVCRLTVTDAAGNVAFDEFTLVWDTVQSNVNAGSDAILNVTFLQDATVSDPAPSSGIVTYLWTQVSGPGTVTFGTPDTEDTTVSVDMDGTYVCRLTVTDAAGNVAFDEFTLLWDTTPPTVDAGADVTVNATYLQDATATDPAAGIDTYLWTQESGPGTIIFGTPDAEDTTVSANMDGTYVCRLTVTDNVSNSAFDEFTLIWDTVQPIVDAGTDATINALYLQDATVSDPAPSSGIATYLWTQESGPGTVTFGTPDAVDTNVDADTDGTYVCRLTVTDNAGNSAFDEFTLVWDTVSPSVGAGVDATTNVIYLQDATVSDPAPSSGIATYLWTQESGPGTVTFGTPDSEDTTVSADTDGTYICRLAVTDNVGNSAFDEFTLVWDTIPPNVNAGVDATINALYLQDATVSDPAPSSGIATYLWTQESGPGTATFGTPDAVDTNVDADTDGTYVCRLTVTDNAGNSAYDEFTFIWDATPPSVDAGVDATTNVIYLQDAIVSDPAPSSGIATYLWTQESGPGTVTFGTPDAVDTNVDADTDGTYVCRLTVTDNAGNSVFDEFTLLWDATPPSVDAGVDATTDAIYLQDAIVSDPAPSSGIATYLWTQESGPGTVTFGTPDAVDTNVDADADGTYVCRLTVTDNAGNSAFDEFTLVWDTTPPNVEAGVDAIINVSYLQDATVSDPAPSSGIVTYLWTQESGPGTVTFGTPDAEDSTISASTDGTYVCRLTVTDAAGNSAFDEFTLLWDTVSPNVEAGADATDNAIYLQDTTVSDPAPSSGIATYLWTQESGPGAVAFGNPGAEDTMVGADADGTYVCRLTVTDNAGNSAFDEFTLVWDTVSPNVEAGTDAIINVTYLQDATGSDPVPSSGFATYLWAQVSGPGTVTFGTPDTEDTTLSADTDGTYVCRLTVTDSAGNSAFDDFTLVWDTAPPDVDAGVDAVANVTYLQDAIASDPAPSSGIASYLWTQESGPGTLTFGTPDAEDTTLSADSDGTYICRLTVTDNAGNTAFDELTLAWDTVPPDVNAGVDAVVNVTYLQDATVSDPAPSSGIATFLWTQVSGPGTLTFGTPDAEDTTLSAETDGTYICRLTATDNAGNSAYDELTLVWDSTPPTVDAGFDAILSAIYSQNATVTDLVSGIASYQWTQESGPGTITFGTPDTEDTTVSANTDGTYVCRLTVSDNAGNSAFDEFTLIWDTEPPKINHTEVTDGAINEPIIISVDVTDALAGVDTVELFYKRASDDTYTSITMIQSGNTYNIQITPYAAGTWEYYIKATDKSTGPNTRYYGLFGNVTVEPNAASDIDINVIGEDIIPPLVSTTSPSGTNVPITTTIIIIFNEPMDNASVESAFSMGGVAGAFFWTGNTLTFSPENPLSGLTQYTVQIDTSAKDEAGNSLSSVFSFQFTTAADPSKPTITDWSPKGSDIKVNSDIKMVFNKEMNQASVEDAFSVSPTVGTGDFSWDGNELTFDPTALFVTNKQYTVTIGSGARDTEGNYIIEFDWVFTTETEATVTLPIIEGKEPTGNNVPVNTEITVEFNVAMDVTTNDAFIMSSESGDEIEGNYVWTFNTITGTHTLTFTPLENLKYSTQYNVSISTEAMSEDGEYLQMGETWLFKTESEIQAEPEKDDLWDTLEPLITAIMILVSLIAFLIGFFKLKQKKNKLRVYLEKIDDIYEEYKEDPKVCEQELVTLRDTIKKEVKDGKIEENHFLILDKKIDDYLNEIANSKKGQAMKGGLVWKGVGRNPMIDLLQKKKDDMAKAEEKPDKED